MAWAEIHYALQAVIDFARFHFQFEEALMRLYAYPDLEAHCKAHQGLLAQASGVVGDSLKDRTREDVAEFFRDWLANHIQGADKGYAEHILAGAKVVRTAENKSGLQ